MASTAIIPRPPCLVCGENIGVIVDGAHDSCRATRSIGMPTITKCVACKGSGVGPSTPRAIFASSLNSVQIALLLASVLPKCEHCGGVGSVTDREILEDLIAIAPND